MLVSSDMLTIEPVASVYDLLTPAAQHLAESAYNSCWNNTWLTDTSGKIFKYRFSANLALSTMETIYSQAPTQVTCFTSSI